MNGSRDLPALDLLKAFDAAARNLSFTRAGAELFLSQSAVSRQIQQLEQQLGVTLFIRRVRALVLTELGRQYHTEVSQALRQLREAGTRLRATPVGQFVTVTTTVTFASLWLVPLLADFQDQHPEVEVRIAADNAVRDLKRDRLDVAIRYTTRRLAGEGAVRLFGERTQPVCSSKLPGIKTLRRGEDLSNFVLLHFDDPRQHTPWLTWNVWFETMRIKPTAPKGVLRFNQYDMMLRAAINGQGIALGRLPLVTSLLDDGSLIAPLDDKRYASAAQDRAYWLMAGDMAHERSEVRTFIAWLIDKSAPLGKSFADAE